MALYLCVCNNINAPDTRFVIWERNARHKDNLKSYTHAQKETRLTFFLCTHEQNKKKTHPHQMVMNSRFVLSFPCAKKVSSTVPTSLLHEYTHNMGIGYTPRSAKANIIYNNVFFSVDDAMVNVKLLFYVWVIYLRAFARQKDIRAGHLSAMWINLQILYPIPTNIHLVFIILRKTKDMILFWCVFSLSLHDIRNTHPE